MASKSKQTGFTVVELMISTAIFSMVLVLVVATVVFIGRQYQQAATRVKLEDASRELHQQVGQSIQFSSTDPINSGASNGWMSTCIGTQRYTFAASAASVSPSYTTASYTNLKKGLYVETIVPTTGSCAVQSSPDTVAGATNLLSSNSRVLQFYFSGGTLKTYFADSDPDLLNLTAGGVTVDSIRCLGGVNGKQFCAVVQLSSTATKRIN